MKLMNFSSCRKRYQILATWNSLKVDGKPIKATGHAGFRPIIRPSTPGSPAVVRKDFHNSPAIAHSTGQSEVFTTLMFWFSFQLWALTWGVLLQVCLQTCVLTLFSVYAFGEPYVSTECGEGSFPMQVGFTLFLLLHVRFSTQ